MKIEQYDTVVLQNGLEGCVVEILLDGYYLLDVGSSPKDWETIEVHAEDIARISHKGQA